MRDIICGLIFNPIATMDWIDGKATLQSASDIAAVIDSARLKYTMPETVELIYVHEILDQCRKQNPNIKVPDLPPILQNISDNSTITSALLILTTQVLDYAEKEKKEKIERLQQAGLIQNKVPGFSALEWVEDILKRKISYPEDYQNRKDDFKDSLSEDIKRRNEYFCDRERYRKDWIKRYLKIDKILKAFNPEIDVDVVLDDIHTENCPAVILYWTVREKRMKQGKPPTDNDVDDYMLIPVVPYADIVLIEKNLRAFILQADKNLKSKVFSNVSDALNALVNQKFTY
jgi:hypothetical protein